MIKKQKMCLWRGGWGILSVRLFVSKSLTITATSVYRGVRYRLVYTHEKVPIRMVNNLF